MIALNETHNPGLLTWVVSGNVPGTDFPIQNLPFAVFRRAGSDEPFRAGVALGDRILDLAAARGRLRCEGPAAQALEACQSPDLNALMGQGPAAWSALRLALSRALRAGSGQQDVLWGCLLGQAEAEFKLPARIGDYTDFYTSIHHATRVGRLFRPEHPLLPNYRWMPVGYHGRSSSIRISGEGVRRPVGQIMLPGLTEPCAVFSARLDYELELGAFIGTGNGLGDRIPIATAESHVFGLCLLNDWSARDLQSWEYQPLGPFLSKNFCTQISPWIITLEALAPFRCALSRPADDPQPLAYLASADNLANGAFDIMLEVALQTRDMQERAEPAAVLGRTSYRHAYWTLAQLVAHHTVNGCNLQPGDLIGTGTQSGPGLDETGCLLEATAGGRHPLRVGQASRTFLQDGDTVEMRGWCERAGAVRIGFGALAGTVLPAVP